MRLVVFQTVVDFVREETGLELKKQVKATVYDDGRRGPTYDVVESEIESMQGVVNFLFDEVKREKRKGKN